MSTTVIKELLAKITEGVEALTAEMEQKGVNESTFDIDSPDEYDALGPTSWIQREGINEHLQDLIWILQGPKSSITNFCATSLPDITTLNVLNYFDFWAAIPIEGDASYEEISQKVRLPIEAVRRIIEHAFTFRLLAKVNPADRNSRVKHNSRSATIARNRGMRGDALTLLDSNGPPLLVLSRALDEWARGKDEFPKEIGKLAFNVTYSGGMMGKYDTLWDMIEEDGVGDRKGWRQGEMVEAMRWLKDQLDLEKTISALTDWNDPPNAHLVDIGGSAGHDDVVLAKLYPDLKITVEDLPKCEPDFHKSLPPELKDRVSFKPHSFFDEQPVIGDIYMFKFIFYDWPKPLASQIIKSLVPALRPGTKILCMELISFDLPEGIALPLFLRRYTTAIDVRMMSLFGHSERTARDVQELFTDVDERFEVVRADSATVPKVLMMEMVWRG